MTSEGQQRVAAFAQQHNLLHEPATHALDLVSEVGEVAKEILKATDYGQRPLHRAGKLARNCPQRKLNTRGSC